MKRNVVLSIKGSQRYEHQEPEVIELLTEGTMEFRDGGWDICYEESELTGLEGVHYLPCGARPGDPHPLRQVEFPDDLPEGCGP
jgi:hypothetical protein